MRSDPYNDGVPGNRGTENLRTHTPMENREQEELSPEEQMLQASRDLWLRRARAAYRDSTDYLDQSIRSSWERSLNHFRNQHGPGSKYYAPEYAKRSKTFRPKTRAAIRNHEATIAQALFSTRDLLSITPQDEDNPESALSAKIHQALVQYRLEHSIPWFLTAIGAYQDTHNYGVCISRQHWAYRTVEHKSYEPEVDENGDHVYDEEGNLLGYENIDKEVIEDRPRIDLIAPDNFRFDQNADWRNPIEDSPFLIELIPMYAIDVRQAARTPAHDGAPQWIEYTLAQICSAGARRQENDSTRRAREGENRADTADNTSVREHKLVWVHRNIIRDDRGVDMVFYTLGENLLLSDPVPLKQETPLGRDYAIGMAVVETHRNYPAGTNELGAPLQEEINDVANQRSDNVKLVLNKRYFYKRQKQGALDIGALMRNVPGGAVACDDPNTDVKVIDTNDVTGSSYQENDRLNIELDELLGTFSQASVQNSRNMNETVGGMSLASQSANGVQELTIRTFIETWVEPVLRHLVKLEAKYETDSTVLALAGKKANMGLKYGVSEVTDELLDQSLVVKVNVGMGSTNPAQKIQKLQLALNMAAQLPTISQRLNEDEIAKEVFGYAGYNDGARFLVPADQVEAPEPQPDPNVVVAEIRAQVERERMQAQGEKEAMALALEREIAFAKLAAEQEMTMTQLYEKLGLEREKADKNFKLNALRERNRTNEMLLKQETGSGI